MGGQLRVPGGSDGCISKHAVNRLIEFITLGKSRYTLSFFSQKLKIKFRYYLNAEHPSVRAFALAPGYMPTRIAVQTGTITETGEGDPLVPLNTVALPAATMLYLTSGRADWLSGRFVHFTICFFLLVIE